MIAECFGPEGFGNYKVQWGPDGPHYERVARAADGLLAPGFVDIHIHGAFGIDFMSAELGDMKTLGKRLAAIGYETYLPTTVTASPEKISSVLANLPDDPIVGGFHLEGPFISKEYPGAQPPEAIVEPPAGPSEWDAILDDPRLKVVTLAPEAPRALDLINRLSNRGVIVSMGHTNATFAEARRGFEFGARHTTHTFNAMRPLHHREAGTVGYALSNPTLQCELIYDRLHVCKDAAQVLLNAKGAENVIAVSDATMAAGEPGGKTFVMWGLEVETGRKDVRLKSNGALAGSAITLLDAFQNLASDFGPEVAMRLCCLNPRRALAQNGPPKVYLEFDSKLGLTGIRQVAS